MPKHGMLLDHNIFGFRQAPSLIDDEFVYCKFSNIMDGCRKFEIRQIGRRKIYFAGKCSSKHVDLLSMCCLHLERPEGCIISTCHLICTLLFLFMWKR